MRLEDAGLYMCQINTDPMTSQSAWLSVQIPPDIDMARCISTIYLRVSTTYLHHISRTSSDVTAREHEDTARLTCRAHGRPRPTIAWRREGGGKIRVRTAHHQHRAVEVRIYRYFDFDNFGKLLDVSRLLG